MRAVGIDPDQRGASGELARKAGLSESQTSRWLKRGDQPTIENLRKLAPVLRVRMADLLVQAGYVTPEELAVSTTTAERGIIEDPTLSDRERRMMLTLLNQMRDRDDDAPPAEPKGAEEPEARAG